jgi:hypothetical protein
LLEPREAVVNEDIRLFRDYYALSTKLIDAMSKEELAECARILALQIADYRMQLGDIPERDALDLLGLVHLTPEQAKLLANGMEILTYYAVAVAGVPEERLTA